MRTRTKVVLVALVCVLVVVAGYLVGPAVGRLMHPTPTASPTSSQERDASVQALSSLETVLVRTRTKVAGYDRSCSPGHGCVFGPAWSDDTTAAGGHNGCDTRNDVLAGQLQDVDKGTSRCVVQAGTLDDPYSGARIEFRKAQADEVQIDHVVPLAYAWDMGASAWTLEARMAFANDEPSTSWPSRRRPTRPRAIKGPRPGRRATSRTAASTPFAGSASCRRTDWL